jgi:hypothetical protein
MTDQRIEKWKRWIDGPIKNEILSMHLKRDTWQQVQQMIADNGQLPDSYWWEFMRDTYAITQAVAVRRQVYADKDAQSLGKLVVEIGEDPSELTREFWIGMWADDRPYAERAWAEQFGGGVGGHLDPAIPAADLDALRDASQRVTDYVDRHLAHSDRRALPASKMPTLADMHSAVDTIGQLYERYYNLLTASSWAFLVPVIQHDWQAVFREPWMRQTGR